MTDHNPAIYTISCIVFGENRLFSVKIQENATVEELKEAIKAEKGMFASVSANRITLYPVNILIEGDDLDMSKVRAQIAVLHLSEQMRPSLKLHEYYSAAPPEKMLHILVQPPNITIPEKRPSTPTRKRIPSSPDIPTVQAKIKMFVDDQLRPTIRKFFKEPPLTHWKPPETVEDEVKDFYDAVKIPAVAVRGRPSLLLHNLRGSSNPHAKALFMGKPNRILWNVSGSGKTRLLFEGLCQHWGFYFVTARGSDDIGSRDLEEMIVARSDDLTYVSKEQSPEHRRRSYTANDDIATREISKVVLARWIVFLTFLEEAKGHNGGVLTDDTKFDWLLFQALPPRILWTDPFLELIKTCLGGVDTDGIRSLNLSLINPEAALGSNFDWDKFFYVLDDAQVGARQHMGYFSDADGEAPRPVLQPILRVLRSNAKIPIVIAGTWFSLDHFKIGLASGLGVDFHWLDEYETGDFMIQNVQLAYVTSLLPPAFLASKSGMALLRRMYEWLRGRHIFTAGIIEQLLNGPWNSSGPAAPHKSLNAYVKRLSGFAPFDSDSTLLTQEPDVKSPSIETFAWERIKREGLLDVLAKSLYDFVSRGTLPMWREGRNKFLLKFELAGFTEADHVTMTEPLVLVAIMHYLESEGKTLGYNILLRAQDNEGVAFKEAVLWALTKLLGNGTRMEDLFRFEYRMPPWEDCSARIVTRNPSGDFVDFDIITEGPVLSSAGLAYHAKEPEDVKTWLESGQTGWCLPGPLMGPDLLARIRLSTGEFVLLVIQAKYYSGEPAAHEPEAAAKVIRSLRPDNWFAGTITSNMAVKTQQKKQRKINDMLKKVNLRDEGRTRGKYHILRVVAAFPRNINLTSRPDAVQKALLEDEHPLVSLPHTSLTSVIATTPTGSDMIRQLHDSLNRKGGADGNDGNDGVEDTLKSKRVK